MKDIGKSAKQFSRDNLNADYFEQSSMINAFNFQHQGYRYQIYLPLAVNKYDSVPVFSSVTIRNIPPQGTEKSIVIASYKSDKTYKDEARLGELVFLLAAKLKYDLLCGLDYDNAGFLYSRELVRLKEKCKATNVPPSILRSLKRFYNKPHNLILKKLCFGRDQLWHLVCHYGKSDGTPKENRIMWWLNILPEDIAFLDDKKKHIADSKLKSLLKKLFPKEYLIKPEERDEFHSIMEEEKYKRLAAEKNTGQIIMPGEISSSDTNTGKKVAGKHLVDFTDFIEDRAKDFVGRTKIFQQIDTFVNSNYDYVFIKGDPGFGKSAIAAKVVSDEGYIHHFNIRSDGRNTAELFMKNVCFQLIQNYSLDDRDLSGESFKGNNLLLSLLKEASGHLPEKQHIVVVIDALDEVRIDSDQLSSNVLYLPRLLPEMVTFVITMRDDKSIIPRLSKEHKDIYLRNDDSNMHDIEDYIMLYWDTCEIREYLKKIKLPMKDFVSEMINKSDGNFMYLRHVLPEIAKGKYKNLDIKHIPVSLLNYYDDHFKKIDLLNEAQFHRKIRLLYTLSEIERSVSCKFLAEAASEKASFVQKVLIEWSQFLHRKKSGNQTVYTLYHNNFREYLKSNDLIQAAGIDLKEIKENILRMFESLL